MASVKTLVTVKRAGVYHPPGTVFHDFDLDEAKALGKSRVVILDGDEQLPAPPAPESTESAPGGVPGASEADPGDAPPGAPVPASAPGGASSRIAEIMAAFDLLDESDWTAAGRPKVKPIADVLGFKPSADEIDAALKLRETL